MGQAAEAGPPWSLVRLRTKLAAPGCSGREGVSTPAHNSAGLTCPRAVFSTPALCAFPPQWPGEGGLLRVRNVAFVPLCPGGGVAAPAHNAARPSPAVAAVGGGGVGPGWGDSVRVPERRCCPLLSGSPRSGPRRRRRPGRGGSPSGGGSSSSRSLCPAPPALSPVTTPSLRAPQPPTCRRRRPKSVRRS